MEKDATGELSQKPELEFQARIEQSLARIKDERVRAVFGLAIASLDPAKLENAQKEFEALSKQGADKDAVRVADIPRRLEVASPLAVAWDLADSAPLKILGIGRGSTHLLCCAKALGHRATVAMTTNPAHDRLMALYGLDHFVQKRASDVPNSTFEIVVSANHTYASTDRWAAFFRPLMPVMAPEGRLILTVLGKPVPERGFDPETVLSMFEQLGARVSRNEFSVTLNKQQMASLIGSVPRVAATPVDAPRERAAQQPNAAGVADTSSPHDFQTMPTGKLIPARNIAILAAAAVLAIAAVLWMWI
jgi:hypothetical protein